MTDMDLCAFLRARLDEDEQVARAACDERAATTGEHWRWEFLGFTGGRQGDGVTDEPVDLSTQTGEFLTAPDYPNDNIGVSLRSVEEYPYRNVNLSGPTFAIRYGEEQPVTSAIHIARHDPARVLAEVQAKRALLAVLDGDPFDAMGAEGAYELVVLQHLALPYANHPDYQPEWKP